MSVSVSIWSSAPSSHSSFTALFLSEPHSGHLGQQPPVKGKPLPTQPLSTSNPLPKFAICGRILHDPFTIKEWEGDMLISYTLFVDI